MSMQSALRTIASRTLRGAQRTQTRKMGAGPPGGFWAEGAQPEGHVNGRLFNETPPPPGQSRKWESWEAPWYLAFGTVTVMLVLGLNNKPNTSSTEWAKVEAQKRLDAAGK